VTSKKISAEAFDSAHRKNDFSFIMDIEQNGLSNNLQRIDYLPHSEVGSYQQRGFCSLSST